MARLSRGDTQPPAPPETDRALLGPGLPPQVLFPGPLAADAISILCPRAACGLCMRAHVHVEGDGMFARAHGFVNTHRMEVNLACHFSEAIHL